MLIPDKDIDCRQREIDYFFAGYSEEVNKLLSEKTSDIAPIAKSFARCFIEATPLGINFTKNDRHFRETIPQGYKFYRSIGITSREIISKQIEVLDNYHTMAKVHWRSSFVKADSTLGQIEFDVSYFLRKENASLKIFMCITGDEQAALKAKELI